MLSRGNGCGFIKSHLLDVCSFIQDRPALGIRPRGFLVAWMILIMNVDGWIQSNHAAFSSKLRKEENDLGGLSRAVTRLAQVNPGVQEMPDFPFPSPPPPPPSPGLDLARDLDSPGPRFSHHDPSWENRPNHSTASAGSVLTQSPGEEL